MSASRGLVGAALGAGLTAAHYNGVDVAAFIPRGGGGGGGGAAANAAVDRLSALVERLALDRGAAAPAAAPSVTLINPGASGKGGSTLLTVAAVGGAAVLAAHALAPEWLPATRGSLARALHAVSKTVRAMGDALKQRVDGLDAKADALGAGQSKLADALAAARADLETLSTDVGRVGRDAGDAADGVGLLVRVVREILGGGRASAGAAAELDAFAARRRCAAPPPPLAGRKFGLESLLSGEAAAAGV